MDEKVSVPSGSQRLEDLIRERFPAAGKAERIARARAALQQEAPIHLTPEQWKWVAEDPDLEEEF